MAYVIPTLRTASRLTYTPPAMQRKSDIAANSGDPAPAADFRTILKYQSDPPAATPAAATQTAITTTTQTQTQAASETAITTPAQTQTAITTPAAPASPAGTIGTVTPWSPTTVAPAAAAVTSPLAPTAQSLFGANPWSTNAGGSGPNGSYSYNPYYFATPQTAATVAQMLGGRVVTVDAITPYGPFEQNQPNQMVQMPDGRLINAGLVAGFYDHGYTQQTVDSMIAAEVSGNCMYS